MNTFLLTIPKLNPHDRRTICHTLDGMGTLMTFVQTGATYIVAGQTNLTREQFMDEFANETDIPRNEWMVSVVEAR